MVSLKKTTQAIFVSILFLTIFPTLAHLLFSSLGFNPTDDGFILAISRRILEGQIPHRDFISIRPIFSSILHLPFVLLGGDYVFWASRFFVWFQFTCIAWVWIYIIEKILGLTFELVQKISIALIAFVVSINTFPIMAWHTIDGLFLISLGLALCVTQIPTNKLVGYFLISLAYLCKQNFVFVAPLILIVLADWRRIKYWLVIVMPGTIYVIFLYLTHALPDAILQMTSQQGILSDGFQTYFNKEVLLGMLIGVFSFSLANTKSRMGIQFYKGLNEWVILLLLFVMPLLYVNATLITGSFIPDSSFFLFGLVVGAVGYFLIKKPDKFARHVRIGLLVLITAWSASLSIGYNYPVLVSGELLAVLFAFLSPIIIKKLDKGKYIISILIFTAITLFSFGVAREKYIYREQAMPTLTKPLDGVLPGGKWIRTNTNSYNFLVDLQYASKVALDYGKTYTIIPDCAGYWVTSPQANPLPIDWPQGTELNNQDLLNRVIRKLDVIRNNNIVIVQKVEAYSLAQGLTPLGNEYLIVNYVRQNFIKIAETTLFELYK